MSKMPKKSGAKQPTPPSTKPDESTSANVNALEGDENEADAQPDKQVDKKQAADLEKVKHFLLRLLSSF